MQQFAKKLRVSIFNKMHGGLLDANQISNTKYPAHLYFTMQRHGHYLFSLKKKNPKNVIKTLHIHCIDGRYSRWKVYKNC